MSQETPTRVLVVDDHAVVRGGLRLFLLAFDDLELVGDASSGERALAQCADLQPDVVLMDLVMPGMGGVEAIRLIRQHHPAIQVIALTSFPEDDLVQAALRAGAIGYLLKTISRNELIAAVTSAAAGEHATRSGELRRMAGQMSRRDESAVGGVPLTPRENQVLRLVAMGLSNQEIANTLEISIETVKEHVQNLLRKLALGDRTQAAVWALRHGLA